MTTHLVEIRPSEKRRLFNQCDYCAPSGFVTWTSVASPMSLTDAENLCKVIGPHWEVRVVPLVEAELDVTRDMLFGIIESADWVKRWRKVEVVHHPDCGNRDVHWTTTPAKILTGEQWVRVRHFETQIDQARTRAFEIGVAASGYEESRTTRERTVFMSPARDHIGHCRGCGGDAKGVSVQITIVAGCRHMVREYAL